MIQHIHKITRIKDECTIETTTHCAADLAHVAGLINVEHHTNRRQHGDAAPIIDFHMKTQPQWSRFTPDPLFFFIYTVAIYQESDRTREWSLGIKDYHLLLDVIEPRPEPSKLQAFLFSILPMVKKQLAICNDPHADHEQVTAAAAEVHAGKLLFDDAGHMANQYEGTPPDPMVAVVHNLRAEVDAYAAQAHQREMQPTGGSRPS